MEYLPALKREFANLVEMRLKVLPLMRTAGLGLLLFHALRCG